MLWEVTNIGWSISYLSNGYRASSRGPTLIHRTRTHVTLIQNTHTYTSLIHTQNTHINKTQTQNTHTCHTHTENTHNIHRQNTHTQYTHNTHPKNTHTDHTHTEHTSQQPHTWPNQRRHRKGLSCNHRPCQWYRNKENKKNILINLSKHFKTFVLLIF